MQLVVFAVIRRQEGEKKMKNQSYHTDSRKKAWRLVDSLFWGDYTYDVDQSHVTGYPIYLGTLGGYIADIGVALDILTIDGDSITVWIDEIWE